jgi:hypothetical protein
MPINSEQERQAKNFYNKAKKWTDEDWVDKVNAIPNPNQRMRVAAKIWWEWTASTKKARSFPKLKAVFCDWLYQQEWLYDPKELKKGLMMVGYPEFKAEELSRDKTQEHKKKREMEKRSA